MSVSNGQAANQTSFNTAFVSRTVDTSTVGQLDLLNADSASGASVTNAQRELNGSASFTGRTPGGAKDEKPSWSNNDVGSSTDNLKVRADAITAKFNSTAGHKHTGAAGDAPQITATDLAGVALRGYFARGTDLSSISGTSTVVTTQMSGKTASSGTTAKGVVVTAPYNLILIRDNTSATQGDQLVDSAGNGVYGRLTKSGSVWTLSFYTNIAGVETAYSLTSQNLQWFYQELFNPVTDAPVYNELASVPSDNATQDVIDATSSIRGLVSTAAQSWAGVKTFVAGIVGQAYLALNRADVASTASITALSSANTFTKLTGSTATTIHGVTAGVDGQVLTLHNGSSATATIKHQSGSATAANRLKLPDGNDISLGADSSIEFVYDTNQSRWVIKSGSSAGGGALTVTGTRASPQSITAGGGIAFTGTGARQMWFVQGNGGAVDVSANPQIAAATTVGQELILVGRDDTNTVFLESGTGLSLNGEFYLAADSVLGLFWDGTNWVEMYRRN